MVSPVTEGLPTNTSEGDLRADHLICCVAVSNATRLPWPTAITVVVPGTTTGPKPSAMETGVAMVSQVSVSSRPVLVARYAAPLPSTAAAPANTGELRESMHADHGADCAPVVW